MLPSPCGIKPKQSTLIPRIPTLILGIHTLIPYVPTLIPGVPIIPLISFLDSPFLLIRIYFSISEKVMLIKLFMNYKNNSGN